MTFVSKKISDYTPPNRWIASLSNGETIFEDCKPGEEIAWDRLRKYVHENGLSITNLRVQFQNGSEVKLPSNQEGYIQKKKAWSTGDTCGQAFCIGYASGGLSMIHEVDDKFSSKTIYGPDPGWPWTIHQKSVRDGRIANGLCPHCAKPNVDHDCERAHMIANARS
jgi:hypothetical protein